MTDKPGRSTAAQRKSLADVVFEKLNRAIKSGAYAADERLPTEHDLAAEFQVSRPVIREALRRLRDNGLVYSRRGAGSFVRQVGLREPIGFGHVASIADLDRCYEFRITLEPEAAAAAARRHDAVSMAPIDAALAEMRDATQRRRHREDADFAFHLAIARASDNRYFATAMEALEDHIAVGMQFHGMSLKITPDGLVHVYEEHKEIAEAIREGRADRARDLMRAHLIGSRDRLFEGRRAGLGESA
ncbi:FadR/GntR family transcriptional regulator [Psychromarinibacter sp. C21-152]|uniref:FadR/GntR family transcriptional regulator n=1 Tax=Psychromarinibacter sediminicola TaxID=3033385 RepID=A0AAE3NQL6_9RHOB|nr:FadR/GntR family transcriptional regulator [Psychromarinibacter sediminicola]MDF0600281.1 FadR/GntR family transcriptional regulator [Psychromarinibacter sediminicola]